MPVAWMLENLFGAMSFIWPHLMALMMPPPPLLGMFLLSSISRNSTVRACSCANADCICYICASIRLKAALTSSGLIAPPTIL